MQQMRAYLIAGLIFFVPCHLGAENFRSSLLSVEDVGQELEEHRGQPALSSALQDEEPWFAFNKWLCFGVQDINIECDDTIFGEDPQAWLSVSEGSHLFQFAISPEINAGCEKPIESWSNLLRDTQEACFFGAHLQDISSDRSLWILQSLKTEEGYWRAEANRSGAYKP